MPHPIIPLLCYYFYYAVSYHATTVRRLLYHVLLPHYYVGRLYYCHNHDEEIGEATRSAGNVFPVLRIDRTKTR